MAEKYLEHLLWCPPGYTPIHEIPRRISRWISEKALGEDESDFAQAIYFGFADGVFEPLTIAPELISRRLRSAAILSSNGKLVALSGADWRRSIPTDDGNKFAAELACAGREISYGSEMPFHTCRAIVAQHDLAVLCGHQNPPGEPAEVPEGWTPQEDQLQIKNSGWGASRQQTSGGRKPHKHKDAFVREMMRRADMDNLPDEKNVLVRDMKEWAETAFGDDCPGDQTMRDWVEQLFWRSHLPAGHGNLGK